MVNLFKVQKKLKSYKYPILKIIVCVIILLMIFLRYKLFYLENEIINKVVTSLCFVLTLCGIFCIYISVIEISNLYTERKKQNRKVVSNDECRPISFQDIIELLEQNDIIEIEIKVGNEILKIGSSSDCDGPAGEFFDKLYYIEKNDYKDINRFRNELLEFQTNMELMVISIDGVKVRRDKETGAGSVSPLKKEIF